MVLQGVLVGGIVGCCCVYAAWSLMPNALQRVLARQGLRLPLPRLLSIPLLRALQTTGGCGSCGGCQTGVAGAQASAVDAPAAVPCKPVVFYPRER